jgi:hypothetical protein
VTDREKLYAILTNLVKNAIKYTNEGAIDFGYTVKKLLIFCERYWYRNSLSSNLLCFEFIQVDIENIQARQGRFRLAISKAFVQLVGWWWLAKKKE